MVGKGATFFTGLDSLAPQVMTIVTHNEASFNRNITH